jgi:hypothetical protein
VRGPPHQPNFKRQKALPNVSTAITTTIPAPVGGWNARDPISSMPPMDALILDNIFPDTASVVLRGGKSTWSTGLSGDCKSLLTYNTLTGARKIFASTDSGIYDVTAGGAVGAAVSACTNGKWESINFTNSGGTYLFLANGTDAIKSYNGAAWANPAITVATPTAVNNLAVFKHRIWLIQNNSLSAYYLPTDAIAGAAVEFPMGPLFVKGGYLVAQASWTFDGGNGVDDYFVTVTSEGECAVYQGTDPAAAATFALVGVYYIGKPIGKKCFLKYGGDLLYISQNGVDLLSKFLQSVAIERNRDAFSSKIDGAFDYAVVAYGGNFGWHPVIHEYKNCLMINVPVTQYGTAYQYNMNLTTKAWCRFTGWDMTCLASSGNALYGAQGTKVYQLWTGLSDDGTAISAVAQQAYYGFKIQGEKHVELVRPILGLTGSGTLSLAFDTDFSVVGDNSLTGFAYSVNSNVWDTGLWDSAVWQASASSFTDNKWLTVSNDPGFFHSFRLQFTTSTATLNWTSTYYALQPCGIL